MEVILRILAAETELMLKLLSDLVLTRDPVQKIKIMDKIEDIIARNNQRTFFYFEQCTKYQRILRKSKNKFNLKN